MRTHIILILTILVSGKCFSQATIDEIKEDYKKNPQRATEQYINKAVVTLKIPVCNIGYTKSTNRLWDNILFISGSRSVSNGIQVNDMRLEDALKLNNRDTIIIKGILSGRGAEANSTKWDGKDILLRKAQLVQIVSSDVKYRDELTEKYACESCTTDLKKYEQFVIESSMNEIRAKKTYADKPLTLNVVIKEFHKDNINNYIGKGGVAGYVYDGQFRRHIVLYGINPKDYMKLNVGDEIKVTGKFAETPRNGGPTTEPYETITLNECKLLPGTSPQTMHCMAYEEIPGGPHHTTLVNTPCIVKQEPCTCYIITDGKPKLNPKADAISVCFGKKHFYENRFFFNIDSVDQKIMKTDTVITMYISSTYQKYTTKMIYCLVHRNGVVSVFQIEGKSQYNGPDSPLPNVATIARGDEDNTLMRNKVYFFTGRDAKDEVYYNDEWVSPLRLVKDYTAPIIEQ